MLLFGRLYEPLILLDTSLIVLGLAWLSAGLSRAVSKRLAFTPFVFLGLLVPYLWVAGVWWSDVESARPAFFAVPFIAFGFFLWTGFWRHDIARLTALAATTACLMNYGVYVLLTRNGPFAMHRTEDLAAPSPDGRYRAKVVNYDGIAYGYDDVVLSPSRFEFSTLLDRPGRNVAELVMEGDVTGLRWTSRNALTVLVRPGTKFVWRKSKWNGVEIGYVVDHSAEPEETGTTE